MGLKLSISNIAWSAENDAAVYAYMKERNFVGLEIAPTRIFPEQPYEKLNEARAWAVKLREQYGLCISSMQSICYGHTERLFGTAEEREALLAYTKKAIDFAEAVKASNLVFGCPKNRCIQDPADQPIAVSFFRELGDYAAQHGTILSMEANPVIYGTNYINTTADALMLIAEVNSTGFKLNLDFGTVIYNEESISEILQHMDSVHHIHISEPYLKQIEKREAHKDLMQALRSCGYSRFVSIEMGKQDDLETVLRTMDYLAEL